MKLNPSYPFFFICICLAFFIYLHPIQLEMKLHKNMNFFKRFRYYFKRTKKQFPSSIKEMMWEDTIKNTNNLLECLFWFVPFFIGFGAVFISEWRLTEIALGLIASFVLSTFAMIVMMNITNNLIPFLHTSYSHFIPTLHLSRFLCRIKEAFHKSIVNKELTKKDIAIDKFKDQIADIDTLIDDNNKLCRNMEGIYKEFLKSLPKQSDAMYEIWQQKSEAMQVNINSIHQRIAALRTRKKELQSQLQSFKEADGILNEQREFSNAIKTLVNENSRLHAKSLTAISQGTIQSNDLSSFTHAALVNINTYEQMAAFDPQWIYAREIAATNQDDLNQMV